MQSFKMSEIFANVYIQAATMSMAMNAFKKCGIWPINKITLQVIFLTVSTTNVQLANDELETIRDPNSTKTKEKKKFVLT